MGALVWQARKVAAYFGCHPSGYLSRPRCLGAGIFSNRHFRLAIAGVRPDASVNFRADERIERRGEPDLAEKMPMTVEHIVAFFYCKSQIQVLKSWTPRPVAVQFKRRDADDPFQRIATPMLARMINAPMQHLFVGPTTYISLHRRQVCRAGDTS